MLASEIREMNEGDITARINELEEERFRLKFRSATETLVEPLRLRMIRRDVARLKTVLRERELVAAPRPARPATKGAARKAAAQKTAAKQAVTKKGAAKKRATKARTSQER